MTMRTGEKMNAGLSSSSEVEIRACVGDSKNKGVHTANTWKRMNKQNAIFDAAGNQIYENVETKTKRFQRQIENPEIEIRNIGTCSYFDAQSVDAVAVGIYSNNYLLLCF